MSDDSVPATGTDHVEAAAVGRDFAHALGGKDFDRVGELLDPEVDFRALTPNRNWEASSAAEVVTGVLPIWFEDSDAIDEVVGVESGAIGDRERVAYSFRGHNGDGPFVVEQQAYFSVRGARIAWMRVLCSGFRPA